MKLLLLLLGLLIGSPLSASDAIDTTATPSVLQLAKITKVSSKAKFWILYKSTDDLIRLEKEGYAILKTKVKLIRNNQFWLDMWQSSLNVAVGYIVAKRGKNSPAVILPTAINNSNVDLQYFH